MNILRLITRVLAIGAVLLALPHATLAYERYNDGCNNCHGAFTGSVSPKGTTFPSGDKHEMHRGASNMDTNCDLCHTSGDGRDPFTGSSNGTAANTGLGCTGCHQAFGLRAHHANSGVGLCAGCHTSDGMPAPENVKPPYYGTVDTLADGPCNLVASSKVNENWSVGDVLGLDNDGDGLYDAADPDCTPVTARTDIIGIPDANGNSSPDIAALFTNESDGNNYVKIRDGSTGEFLASLNYGTDPTLAIGVAEIAGQQYPAIAVMRVMPTGAIQVNVRSAHNRQLLSNLAYGTAFSGVDMAILPDMNGNNVSEAAVVGMDSNLNVRVLVQDILTGDNLGATLHGPGAEPLALAAMPDLNGNGSSELALLEQVRGDGRFRVRVIDPSSQSVLNDVYYGTDFDPVAMAVVPGPTPATARVAVLGLRSGDSTGRILTKVALTGATVSTKLWHATNLPVDLDTVADTNANGAADLALLEQTPTNEARVRIHDSATGDLLRWMPLPFLNSAIAGAAVGDVNGNGFNEVAGLGAGGVQLHVQIKDAEDRTYISGFGLP